MKRQLQLAAILLAQAEDKVKHAKVVRLDSPHRKNRPGRAGVMLKGR